MESSAIPDNQITVTEDVCCVEDPPVLDLSASNMFERARFTESMPGLMHMTITPFDNWRSFAARRQEHLYLEMFADAPLLHATPYLLNEAEQLNFFMRVHMEECKKSDSNSFDNPPALVVIGAGPYLHLSTADRFNLPYVAVDPCIEHHRNRLNANQCKRVSHHAVVLSELDESQLPDSPRVFVFPFNVMAYIDDKLEDLNRLVRPGDSIFLSSWNEEPESIRCHQRYQRALTGHGCEENSLKRFSLSEFSHHQIRPGQRSSYLCGRVCDALFVQC